MSKNKMSSSIILLAGIAGFSLRWMEPNHPKNKFVFSTITGGLFSASAYCFIEYPLLSTITSLGYIWFGVQDIGSTLFPCF